MLSNHLQKMKSSLNDAISAWANKEAEKNQAWNELDIPWSDRVEEYMTDAAFNVMLAQKDVVEYLKNDGQLEK